MFDEMYGAQRKLRWEIKRFSSTQKIKDILTHLFSTTPNYELLYQTNKQTYFSGFKKKRIV